MPAKNTWLTLRISESDLKAIKHHASSANVSVSGFVRSRCVRDESLPTIVVDRKLLSGLLIALKREGNNLNQLTRYIHSKGMNPEAVSALKESLSAVSKGAETVSSFLIDSKNQL